MYTSDEPIQSNLGDVPGRERKWAVVTALRNQLPDGCVLSNEAELRPYECDGLTAFRQMPLAVVLPKTEEQVREIISICHRLDVPVVARGSGTGLSGGAMPHAAGVVLSLARLNRILEVDPLSRTARVQPGVRNLRCPKLRQPMVCTMRRILRRRSPAPSAAMSRRTPVACIASSTGSLYTTSCGSAASPSMASCWSWAPSALDGPGLDLLAVAIGSEGLLLVVTEITVKLVPRPQLAQVVMASFDDVARPVMPWPRSLRQGSFPRVSR